MRCSALELAKILQQKQDDYKEKSKQFLENPSHNLIEQLFEIGSEIGDLRLKQAKLADMVYFHIRGEEYTLNEANIFVDLLKTIIRLQEQAGWNPSLSLLDEVTAKLDQAMMVEVELL